MRCFSSHWGWVQLLQALWIVLGAIGLLCLVAGQLIKPRARRAWVDED